MQPLKPKICSSSRACACACVSVSVSTAANRWTLFTVWRSPSMYSQFYLCSQVEEVYSPRGGQSIIVACFVCSVRLVSTDADYGCGCCYWRNNRYHTPGWIECEREFWILVCPDVLLSCDINTCPLGEISCEESKLQNLFSVLVWNVCICFFFLQCAVCGPWRHRHWSIFTAYSVLTVLSSAWNPINS